MTARQLVISSILALLLTPILIAVAAILVAGNDPPATCPAALPAVSSTPYPTPDPCPIESPVTP